MASCEAQHKADGELWMELDIVKALLEKKGDPPFSEALNVSEPLLGSLAVACRVAGVSVSAMCWHAGGGLPRSRFDGAQGPSAPLADCELLAEIRDVLAKSPFVGEGHRKVWAHLCRRGCTHEPQACCA